MRIKGQEIDFDILEELQPYENRFERSRIRDNKLQSCSPFRPDAHPSFAVNLETGTWIDSGADQEHMRKGNFISLLMYLSGSSYEEIETYLLEKYSLDFKEVSTLKLKINLPELKVQHLSVLDKKITPSRSEYLKNRGVDYETQQLFKIFETEKNGVQVVGIPWFDYKGNLINIKYRSVKDKKFFYEESGSRIKRNVFGLDKILKKKDVSEVWIVEAEIDALYLWSCGIDAVALGRASINEDQIKLLLKLGCDRLVVATDNDAVGKAIKEILIKEFLPYFKIKSAIFPDNVKDVNELNKEEIKTLNLKTEYISLSK